MSKYWSCEELNQLRTVTLPAGKVFCLSSWQDGDRRMQWVDVATRKPVGMSQDGRGVAPQAFAVVKSNMPRTYRLEVEKRPFDWFRNLLVRFGLRENEHRTFYAQVVEL